LLNEISQAQKEKHYTISPICRMKKDDLIEVYSRMVVTRDQRKQGRERDVERLITGH
jgi:hypothetical protein